MFLSCVFRCADDSYGSYKTQATREVGKYKRATSDTTLLRSHQDPKSFRPLPELDGKDIAETPSKPPRKKLELDSPNQGRRSKSPNMPAGNSHRGMPQVTAYQPPEVSSVQHAQKLVAKPLRSNPGHNMNSSGRFVDTVVQQPAMNSVDRNEQQNEEGPRTSVKDRVKNIEVFSHSPGSNKASAQRSGQTNGPTSKAFSDDQHPSNVHQPSVDSLEQLESTTRNDSFRDRLRPVVRKSESESEEVKPSHTSPSGHSHQQSADDSENMKNMPPMVPNRTYKQTGYRMDQYSNRGPKPYENKSNSSANIHSPLGPSNFMNNYKSDPVPEKRSPGQSLPEPQVPSRSSKPGWTNDQLTPDQNANVSSQEMRLKNYRDEHVQNKENTQHSSVQSGQKRNYDKSFSRNRNSSGGSSNNSSMSDPHSVGSFQNWHSGNTHSDKQMGSHSHRLDNRGDNNTEQKHSPSYSGSAPNRSSYNRSPVQQNQAPEQSHSNTPNTRIPNQSPASIRKSEPIEMKPNPNKEANSPSSDRKGSPVGIPVNHARQPSAEELECDQKAQELAKVLKDSDKELCDVLSSESKKSRMQYLDGIFHTQPGVVEERRPRSGTAKSDKQADEKEEEKAE